MKVVSIRVVNNRPQVKVKLWYKRTPVVYSGYRTEEWAFWVREGRYRLVRNMALAMWVEDLLWQLSKIKGNTLVHEILKNSRWELEQIPVLQDMIKDNRAGMVVILGEQLIKILEA